MRSAAPSAPRANRYARGERLRRLEVWVPRVTVGLVAISALSAALLSGRFDASEPMAEQSEQTETTEQEEQVEQPGQTHRNAQAESSVAASVPASNDSETESKTSSAVVTAPPLKARSTAPRGKPDTQPDSTARADTAAMGAPPAGCDKCGVVETVVAVHGYGQPNASGYQMLIRMDDGTVRSVEQRGALAAGSRVIVERDSVRVLTTPAGES